MPVVIDNQKLPADEMGLHTFGHVLSHLQKSNRLVVHVLIDGQEPDLDRMSTLRSAPTSAHTIFVETTEPQTMAREVLDAVARQVDEADALSRVAGGLLQAGNHNKAFEKLSGLFGMWLHVQQSLTQVSQLLRLDLERISLDDEPLSQFVASFGEQLRGIRESLENRDFVALADVLNYEITESTPKWHQAIAAIRAVIR